MGPHVLVEVAFSGEQLAAFVTFEGLLPRVGASMGSKVTGLSEPFATLVAAVGLLPFVIEHVVCKTIWIGKLLRALFARVRFLCLVRVGVYYKPGFGGEHFVAI